MSNTKCFKIILSILFLLAILKLEAQTTVSIGSGNTRSSSLPIISNYGYTYSQQLYLASEYTTAGGTGLTSISKLRLYYNGTGTGTAAGTSPATSTFDDWTIYIGNTSKTSFASSTDWVPSSALTQVFSGTVTFPAAGNWMEITFATPFLWDGTSNLVVAIDENRPSYGSLVYWGANTATATNRGLYYRNDTTNPSPSAPPTGTRVSNVPFVQFVAQAAAGCTTPAAQPTALAFSSVTGTSLSGSFTVPSPAPTGYMVVRSTSATAPTAPTDGTALAVGSTALGAGTYVVANTATGSFTDSGLLANTQYYYYIYSYNSGCVGTPPKYLTTSPLTGNVTTCMPTPTSAAGNNLSTSSFTANWTGASGDAGYELEVSTSSTFATILAGYPVTIANNGTGIASYNVTGLSPATTYYYRVRATGATCSSTNSTSQTVVTSCGVDTVPTVTQTFATYVPVCWTEATGAIDSALTFGSSAWGQATGMGNTGTNTAAKINLYSTKNDWIISQSINLGSGGNYAVNFDMAVTSYAGTIAQSTLGTHIVRVVVSTDNGATWTSANVIRTYTGTGTYSATRAAQSISLAGYTGIVKIGFLAQTTSTSPDIDFHIDNFQVVAAPPVVTSFLPAAACVDSGASVTITGANLANATGVTVNGTAATITANTSTSLTFTLPNGASTGVVAVTTAEGSGASTANFTVNAYPVLEDIVGGGVSLCKSETVTLSNTTSGGVWTSSDTAIATVDATGLVTAVSEGTVTITYTVTVSGCATAETTSITVNNPPVITAQANNQIVLDGADASYAITATGTGITYQWQVSTDNGATWNNIDGATNSYYIVAAASSADNGKQFQCVVSGTAPCTAATSNVVTLSVGSVSITAQPTNQTVCSDAGATFTVGTAGEVTSYQWQVSTNGTTWTAIEGANAASLVLSGVTSVNTGSQYRCVLNGGDVNSDPATLTVYDAVAIGTQPASQTVCSNDASVTFTCAATGSGLSYQWQMSTNGTDWSNVTGATAATYTINTPSVSLNNSQYRVIVSGTASCSAVTSDTVTVTVNNPVVITYLSPEKGVLPGQTATISVTATGAVSGYQWMMSDDEGATFVALEADEIFEGVTSNTLSINNVDFDFAGLQFQCMVLGTTPCGDATSPPYILIVNNVGIQTHPTSVSICEAGTTSFTTIASSPDETVEITYQWEMNTGNGFVAIANGLDASGLTFDGVTASTLNVSGITLANSGIVFRSRVNEFLNSFTATLAVNNPVVVTTSPANQSVCVNGGTATFEATATGDNLSYQWQMSTNGSTWSPISGATAATLTVTNPTVSMDGYQYQVVVSGAANCPSVTTNIATLNVLQNVTYYVDSDGDGIGAGTEIYGCLGLDEYGNPPPGYSFNNYDCDDTNALIQTFVEFYLDADGDGIGAGTAEVFCAVGAVGSDGNVVYTPPGYSMENGDCNDNDANSLYPSNWYGAVYIDADGDGIGAGESVDVCLDQNFNLPPGYSWENWDCNDNDANSISYANDFYVDADGDGVGAGEAVSFCSENPPPGYSWDNYDCNDNDANSSQPSYWYGDVYIDADGDGFGSGNPISTICLNSDGSLPQGYSFNNSDCDDHFFSSNGLCPLTLNVKLYLQGYYKSNQNQMTPLRKNAGVSLSEDEVDEITVSLYSKYDVINPIIATATAVVGTNGTVGLQFAVLPDEYFILVEHKNTIKTWSATPVAITNGTTYDFTTAASQAYGNNQIEVAPGVYAIYSGDMNQDGTINEADLPIFTTANTTAAHGYVVSDLNGDGSVDLLDYPIYKNNAAATVNAVRPVLLPIASLPNVTIGTQVWQSTNLDVTTYRDGTPIPQVTDPTAWANLTTGAWCYYNNTTANGAIYGKLYNWYAVAGIHDNDPNTPNKILAPEGWHIPTDAEWTTLTTFLGGWSVARGKMKATGTTFWRSPNYGATNSSGFTGLPGGGRYLNGTFTYIGSHGVWWCSSEISTASAWNRILYFNGDAGLSTNKKNGFSVRCLRD